jgi:hypothetical protein
MFEKVEEGVIAITEWRSEYPRLEEDLQLAKGFRCRVGSG